MSSGSRRLEDLRREAAAAALGLRGGELTLIAALDAFQSENERVAETYHSMVRSLALALEARDGYTGEHSDAVESLALAVAGRLGLNPAQIADVQSAALLHDIGKIGVPDRVLHKPGRLDEGEWALMHQHPAIGERILRPLAGFDSVATAVRHAHESWDGRGYPDGLAGEAIPLASRIVLACDAWHALVSDRPYRKALAVPEARAELERCAGTQFDPRVVAALLGSLDAEDDAPALALPAHAGEDELQRLSRELRVLMSLSSAVAGTNSLDELLDLVAEEACSALGAMSLSISRWEAQAEVLRTVVNVGTLAAGEVRHPIDEIYRLGEDNPLKRLLLQGRAYLGLVDDPDLHPVERRLLERLNRRSCLAVPVMLGDIAWGELWASRGYDQPAFDEHDLRLLNSIAGQVAAGVGRAELFGRLAELALQDGLTGLANRRALEERLGVALDGGAEVTLLLCDVDNLKELNDVRGHHGGDWALKAVAGTLRAAAESLPKTMVCRLSGDEFGILAEGASVEDMQRVTEIAIDRLATHRPPVGLSCGIASSRLNLRRPSELLRAADAALYTAKRTGRGRVCLADTDPQTAWRSTGRPGARRARRDGLEVDTSALLVQALDLLDGPLRTAAPLERLEGLATSIGSTLRASAAAVSLCPHGAGVIETLFTLDLRSGHSSSVRFGVDGERYDLGSYPRTADLLAHGGSLHLYAGDADADRAERALLDDWGMTDVLAAAASDGRGAWLLEIYGDAESADLRLADAALRLLAAHAVRPAGGLRVERRATSARAIP
ncbi:MAG: HD domain-containing phosphohydrolase [Solirubrobacteraceae bacterium]